MISIILCGFKMYNRLDLIIIRKELVGDRYSGGFA